MHSWLREQRGATTKDAEDDVGDRERGDERRERLSEEQAQRLTPSPKTGHFSYCDVRSSRKDVLDGPAQTYTVWRRMCIVGV